MRLTLACGRYDRTQPLIDGRVKIEGIDELTYLAQQLTRRRMDVAELFAPNINPALAQYLSATGED